MPGVGADWKPIPWLSFVERKPEPLGAEVKVLADGNSGCFLNLELQEGAEAHARMPRSRFRRTLGKIFAPVYREATEML